MADVSDLTPREMQVLYLMADGHTNDAIAAQLYLSPATVKWVKKRILTALGARNAAHAVSLGHRHGYLTDRATAGDIAVVRQAREMGYRLALVRRETP